MPIDIQEDYDQVDGGYAILTLPGQIGDDGRFQIKRLNGEPDKLGPKGWQPHDAVLAPLSVRQAGGKSVLYLGPDLTQHLMEETEIEISVLALNKTERVVWPYITPSVHADASRGAMGGITQTPQTVTTSSPQPTPVPEEIHDPPVDEPNGSIENSEPDPIVDNDAGSSGRSGWLWVIPIAAVLAGVAYFGFLHDPQEDVVVIEPDAPVAVADTPETPSDTREGLLAEAAACRTDGCDGAAYFDIATRLQDIGVVDVFAVMGLAAENGSLRANEWLAKAFDPLHFEANEGLDQPDLISAFKHYEEAVAAGSTDGQAAKAALCAALENPATASWTVAPESADIPLARESHCQ